MSFIDTNLLVHATVPLSPDHRRAEAALARARNDGLTAISRQIIREYVAVMSRPQVWGRPIPMIETLEVAEAFLRSFRVLEDGPIVWTHLSMLCRTRQLGGKQVHDADIVATMLAHGETRLLTSNGAHVRRFSDVIEVVAP